MTIEIEEYSIDFVSKATTKDGCGMAGRRPNVEGDVGMRKKAKPSP
jgi:hypothetical protein